MSTPPSNGGTSGTIEPVGAAAVVSVKLPEFWKAEPEMWFAQAEAQFILANVTRDDTKFYHIVAKLEQSVICHITDLVSNPPQQDKHKKIKERLISRFALSPETRLERLLSSSDLGDMRPTHLLAKMQDLAAGLNVNNELLKMLFLQRMPQHIRPVLTISDGTLPKLAEMADKLTEFPRVASVSSVPTPISNAVSDQMEGLREQMEVLSTEIRRLKQNSANHRRTRSTSRSSNNSTTTELCWYHRKYGQQAER
ncbi:uncharacterized protein LOC129767129 [Toxorhynchites rutilus septentrionalis]|uniref:uncharacterized protein LOC129767129 n=1 Tax=Toxorhynchites rutilus septentrionalis TaxID=329112 RepID=UPI002479096D|nr:uncharacterized protein LOC129767129 [Toxorhynchites rutilus septentrionalis]